MSAYIPYMKIPEHCGQCRFADRENRIYCSFDGILREEGKITQDDCFIDAETKPEWCPIQEGEHIPVKAVMEILDSVQRDRPFVVDTIADAIEMLMEVES